MIVYSETKGQFKEVSMIFGRKIENTDYELLEKLKYVLMEADRK